MCDRLAAGPLTAPLVSFSTWLSAALDTKPSLHPPTSSRTSCALLVSTTSVHHPPVAARGDPLATPRQHRPPLRPASPPLGLRSLCTILRITTALSGRLASDPRYLSRCSNPTIVADIRLPLNPLERPQRCSPSLALPPRTLHDTQARLSIRNIDSTQRPPSTLC